MRSTADRRRQTADRGPKTEQGQTLAPPVLLLAAGRGPLAGAFAGLCATAPMTVAMLVAHRLLPGHEQYPVPPYEITREARQKAGIVQRARQIVGRGQTRSEQEQVSIALLAHFGFGAAAGAIFGLGGRLIATNSGPARGIIYGLIVWAANYLGLLPATGLYRAPQREPLGRHTMMIVAHVVWGAALGLLFQKLTGADQSAQQTRQQPTRSAGVAPNR